MARQIIILETRRLTDGSNTIAGVNWFPIASVPAQVPLPGFTSVCANLTGGAAMTAPEQAALIAGTTREELFLLNYSSATSTATIKADLQKRYVDRTAAIALEPPIRQFYGVSFDSVSGWSA